MFAGTGAPIPPQDVAEVSKNWPAGNIDVRMAIYLCQAQQKWAITAVPNAGGYPGSPYLKITIAGTNRALAATAAHAKREATTGAYVAQEEAEPVLAEGRANLARLLGVPDGGVAFVPSAQAALDTLLAIWPLREGDAEAMIAETRGAALLRAFRGRPAARTASWGRLRKGGEAPLRVW